MICNSKNRYVSLKRVMDVVISFAAIIVLLPVFIIVSFAIKIDSKGPILFKQKRVGLDNECFNLYKFRTMNVDAPDDCPTSMFHASGMFITKVGKVLRKTSIDELPQLINVLKGEMSIIGPRPLIESEVNVHILRDSSNVYSVLPGITGLAQINGRDDMDIVTKVKFDSDYVNNFGFKLDVKIFLKTIIKVLKGEGIKEGSYEEKANIVIIDNDIERKEKRDLGENACV